MLIPSAHVASNFAVVEALPLTIAATLYARRSITLAKRGRVVPLWRQACFGSGLALIALALFSPLGHISEELFLAHMGEHIVIGDIAALLLVLGLTGPLLQPVLAIRFFDRLKVLAHPGVALPLWALNLYAWHLPALYERAQGNNLLHPLEHTLFIALGCLMWMPLVGPLPMPTWFTNGWRLGYTIGVRFTGTVLANVFMWSGTAYYSVFAPGERYWHITAVADQSTAGVIMMIEGSLITLGVFAWIFFRTAQEGVEQQRLLDLADARGVPLTPARAGRAAAAGSGALLEDRIRAREPVDN